MKLLIADDHTLFRDALIQYIERSDPMISVTLAKDLYQVISILEENPYQDLVMLDLRMPGMEGVAGFKLIREKFPDQRVALMSGIAEPEDVRKALELGAVGYFPKTLSGKAMLNGVSQVVDGAIFVPEEKGGKSIMPSYRASEASLPESKEKKLGLKISFTPREREVIGYLLRGASNKEIANALNVKVVTVKLHVRGVCRKLNAKNRTHAALKAKEIGIT
ncbi:MAG: response regulator [Alphaproteobacteria bacterium]|nr:response regulator [Alphaproteobacteria bacterium]